MSYEYNKNIWESYKDGVAVDKQPNAVITKEKLDNIENGIERASMTLEVGNVTVENDIPGISISTDEFSHTRKINIAFPKSGNGSGGAVDDSNTSETGTWSSEKINSMFEELREEISDLTYKEIIINTFTNNIGTVEKGASFTVVTLNWTLNKPAKTLTINNEEIDPNLTMLRYPVNLTRTTSFTLRATDEKGHTSIKTTTVSFVNGIYYGKAPYKDISEITSKFIIDNCTKSLSSSFRKTFTINPGRNEYIYFAHPTNLGTATFYVGGFEGGFELLGTFLFDNSYGYQELYNVYTSSNSNLGQTTVEVE